MAPVYTPKQSADSCFFGLLQPSRGILLAGKMREGVVRVQDVSAILCSREFSEAYVGLNKRKQLEVRANLLDLVSAGRALYFKDDPVYYDLICQPIKLCFFMSGGGKPGDEKAKAEFFKYGFELPEK